MESDPILIGGRSKINYEVKYSITKEIINSSSVVAIDYISAIVREKPDFIENWILSGIGEGVLKVRIDDIKKLVYAKTKQDVNDTILKTLNFAKESYANSIKNLLS